MAVQPCLEWIPFKKKKQNPNLKNQLSFVHLFLHLSHIGCYCQKILSKCVCVCVCVCVCWKKRYKGREDDHIAGVFCRGVGSNLLKTMTLVKQSVTWKLSRKNIDPITPNLKLANIFKIHSVHNKLREILSSVLYEGNKLDTRDILHNETSTKP